MKKQKENSHEGITWSEMGKQNVQAEKVYCRKLTCHGDRNGSEDWLNMVNQSTDRLLTHVTSQELKKKLVHKLDTYRMVKGDCIFKLQSGFAPLK